MRHTSSSWWTYRQKRMANAQTHGIDVRWGRLRLKSLSFGLPPEGVAAKVTVTAAGKPIPSTSALLDGRVAIELGGEVILGPGGNPWRWRSLRPEQLPLRCPPPGSRRPRGWWPR
jgi:hypothetical protein